MELQNNMNLRKCLFSSVDVTLEGQKECEMYHIYEFEVPNTLVGLLIGVRGKTIKVEFSPLIIRRLSNN